MLKFQILLNRAAVRLRLCCGLEASFFCLKIEILLHRAAARCERHFFAKFSNSLTPRGRALAVAPRLGSFIFPEKFEILLNRAAARCEKHFFAKISNSLKPRGRPRAVALRPGRLNSGLVVDPPSRLTDFRPFLI